MSWDLESILRPAGADRERPVVVEVGSTRDSRGLFWWTGRVAATLSADLTRAALHAWREPGGGEEAWS
jgi:hypothetical protein